MKILNYDISEIELDNEMLTIDSKILTSGPVCRVYLQAINNLLERKMSDHVFRENKDYYTCKLSSTNANYPNPVLEQGRGFSFLKKGDAFDCSLEGFHRAKGQGRLYQATSDFKNGYICADEKYNPEI